MPLINVSLGELVDKTTILKIKIENCNDDKKLIFLEKEFNYLSKIINEINIPNEKFEDLYLINLKLWKIEDDIRACEKNLDFSNNFIELARSVYKTNDKRFLSKSKIDEEFGSEFREQKILIKYTDEDL
jgi:DNA helicase HerA-like ATPase